jgi:chromosome segregation ATPase
MSDDPNLKGRPSPESPSDRPGTDDDPESLNPRTEKVDSKRRRSKNAATIQSVEGAARGHQAILDQMNSTVSVTRQIEAVAARQQEILRQMEEYNPTANAIRRMRELTAGRDTARTSDYWKSLITYQVTLDNARDEIAETKESTEALSQEVAELDPGPEATRLQNEVTAIQSVATSMETLVAVEQSQLSATIAGHEAAAQREAKLNDLTDALVTAAQGQLKATVDGQTAAGTRDKKLTDLTDGLVRFTKILVFLTALIVFLTLVLVVKELSALSEADHVNPPPITESAAPQASAGP